MRKRFARRQDLGLDAAEFRILERLNDPIKIQAFLDAIPQNFERDGQTCLSVREVLRQKRAHCIEGAMLAAVERLGAAQAALPHPTNAGRSIGTKA